MTKRFKNDEKLSSQSITYNGDTLNNILYYTMAYKGKADINADNNKTTGFYIVPETASASNYPLSNGNGLLIVFKVSNNEVIYQIFSSYDGRSYVRMIWYENKGSWKLVTS